MNHQNHALARRIIENALANHADPNVAASDADRLLIVMGAVLEEVSGRKSRKGQAVVVGGGVTAFGALYAIAFAVSKALGV